MRQGLDRTKVLLAAAEIAEAQGYEQLTLAALAQKLGVKVPSLYNHVKGLADLRKALALMAIDRLKSVMLEAAAGRSGEAAVLAVAEAYIRFVREHPGLYEASLRPPDPLDPEVAAHSEGVLAVVARVFESFHLAEDDLIHAIRGLRSLVHGFASIELLNGFNLGLDVDESVRRVLETYLRGLRRGDAPNAT